LKLKNGKLKYALKVQLFIVLRRSLKRMTAIEVGRICVKLAGRETGRKCVIIDVMDKSFVLITGPKKLTGVKRRRVNINHVKPLQEKIEIPRGASDEEVNTILQTAGVVEDVTQPTKTPLA
jgi:large subunit ribosomal protein L14e